MNGPTIPPWKKPAGNVAKIEYVANAFPALRVKWAADSYALIALWYTRNTSAAPTNAPTIWAIQ